MFLLSVGEEDEVSIRDIAYMVVEAMDFKGEVVVSCDLQIWVKTMVISSYHIHPHLQSRLNETLKQQFTFSNNETIVHNSSSYTLGSYCYCVVTVTCHDVKYVSV